MPAKVLVVEDDPEMRFMMEEFLVLLGFDAVTAPDAMEGLRRVAAEPAGFCAVLMDVHMPGITGLDAARRIRALPDRAAGSVPIVAVSADRRYHRRAAVEPYGVTEVLPKPVSLAQLEATLGALIEPR